MAHQITSQHVWRTATQILTPKQLEVFEMHHARQLTLTDIAAHLHITRQAATERLRKAEHRIAQHLSQRKDAA